MKNILVKNSLKSILMSVLILFIIPATNSTIVCASPQKDCDEFFKNAFWEVCNDTKSNNNNSNSQEDSKTPQIPLNPHFLCFSGEDTLNSQSNKEFELTDDIKKTIIDLANSNNNKE